MARQNAAKKEKKLRSFRSKARCTTLYEPLPSLPWQGKMVEWGNLGMAKQVLWHLPLTLKGCQYEIRNTKCEDMRSIALNAAPRNEKFISTVAQSLWRDISVFFVEMWQGYPWYQVAQNLETSRYRLGHRRTTIRGLPSSEPFSCESFLWGHPKIFATICHGTLKKKPSGTIIEVKQCMQTVYDDL